jgi:hypothetical protein
MNEKVYTDGGVTRDPMGAALFDFLLDKIEDFCADNQVPWFTMIGVLAMLSVHMQNAMIDNADD